VDEDDEHDRASPVPVQRRVPAESPPRLCSISLQHGPHGSTPSRIYAIADRVITPFGPQEIIRLDKVILTSNLKERYGWNLVAHATVSAHRV
jgi:hypothetical protein